MPTKRDTGEAHPRYQLDRAFYDKVRAARPQYKLADKFIIPPNNGKGLIVKKGQTFRVIEAEGPQVVDVTFWNAHNPKEFFRPERTFLLEGWFIKPYSRLWSDVPWFRPLATCVEDTVGTKSPEEGWHHHIIIGTHCTPEVYELRSGRAGLNACHLNLLQAIEPLGLKEEDIYDNINIHQKTRLDPNTGRMYITGCDGKAGDYIEFYAEIDLLVAISVCPSGDGSVSGSKPEQVVLRPIGVEVYDTGIQPKEFPGWTNWRPSWQGKWIRPTAEIG